MSRIGKQPIKIPDKVTVAVKDGIVSVKGPLGALTFPVDPYVNVKVEKGEVLVTLKENAQCSRARHGLMRNLVANMVEGVSTGFQKVLDIVGVGYRADVKGKDLVMTLGFSHPVNFPIPNGIKINVEKQVRLTIQGASKELVGDTTAKIRLLRPPEPYKGKGIKYTEEVIIRKAGKSAVGGGAPGASGGK